MADFVEGRGWVPRWYEWLWGHGMQGLWKRMRREGFSHQFWPVRICYRPGWWRKSILDHHGVHFGVEEYTAPVPRGKRRTVPNPYWDGEHWTTWRRTLVSQVVQVGPLRIMLGEAFHSEDRLTDDDIHRIMEHGRFTV